MAGARKPGPQCSYNDPVDINDGTMYLAKSPAPGPVGTTPFLSTGNKSAQGLTHEAELVYDAASEILSGSVGHEFFQMIAYSGGGRGHKAGVKRELAKEYLYEQSATVSSRFATTAENKDADGNYLQRGGPLPPGHYSCHYVPHHPTFHECLQLLRGADTKAIHSPFFPHPILCGRGNDFFIHGSGPKGSDGCIVPANEAERRRLNLAVRQFQGKVTLQVKNVSYMLPAELENQIA